jgi:hypothetical protein
MRFNYLTATMLRNAAIRVEENSLPMCWAIRDELKENGFNQYEAVGIMEVEFESMLKYMGVPTSGWLWLEFKERQDRKWDTDPELKAVRVLFLLMLADAVAYKSNGGKSKEKLNPMSKFPSELGVYVLKHTSVLDPHYSYWNGNHWCFTANDVESANRLGKHYGKSPGVYELDGSITRYYVGWYNKRLDT